MPRANTDWLCVTKNESGMGILGNPSDDVMQFKEFRDLELGNIELFHLNGVNETASDFLSEDLSSFSIVPQSQLVSFNAIIYMPQSMCLAHNLTLVDPEKYLTLTLQRERKPRLVKTGSSDPGNVHTRKQKSTCHKPGYWQVQDPCGLWRFHYLLKTIGHSKSLF